MRLHAAAVLVVFLRSTTAFIQRYGSATLPEEPGPLMREESLPASTLVRAFSATARPGETRHAFAGEGSVLYGHPRSHGFTESAVERSKPMIGFYRKHLHDTLNRAETASFALERARATADGAQRALGRRRGPRAPYSVKNLRTRKHLDAMTRTLGPLFAAQQRRLALARDDLAKLQMQGATARGLDDERGRWESEFRRLRRLEQKAVDFHETFQPPTAEEAAHQWHTEFRAKKKTGAGISVGGDAGILGGGQRVKERVQEGRSANEGALHAQQRLEQSEKRVPERQLSSETTVLPEGYGAGGEPSRSHLESPFRNLDLRTDSSRKDNAKVSPKDEQSTGRMESQIRNLNLEAEPSQKGSPKVSQKDSSSSAIKSLPDGERGEAEVAAPDPPADPPRRPRGRPRKNPAGTPEPPKRPRGRPRKTAEVMPDEAQASSAGANKGAGAAAAPEAP